MNPYFWLVESISILGIWVCFFETSLSAFEHFLPQTDAVLRLAWIAIDASYEGVVLWWTLSFNYKHAGRVSVLPRKSMLIFTVLNTLILEQCASLLGCWEHIWSWLHLKWRQIKYKNNIENQNYHHNVKD
jgi:hypothetical protein